MTTMRAAVFQRDFASIVAAIREGRGIFDNIRKALLYLLTGNTGDSGARRGFSGKSARSVTFGWWRWWSRPCFSRLSSTTFRSWIASSRSRGWGHTKSRSLFCWASSP
jgi:hypothetical protein